MDLSRRTFLAGSAALAGGVLAGCSGSGSSAAQDEAAGQDLTKLTFCLDYTPNTNHTGIYVAQAMGYFADEGLEVAIVQPPEDGAEAMVGTGQAELGVSYQDYLANAFAGGNDGLEAIAAIVQHNTSGIMSRAEDGITHPAAMEGFHYATWELDVEQATIRQIVEDDGGDFDKVKVNMVPYTVDDEVSGLRSNLFDTVWVYEGWAVQNAKVQDFDVNYFSFISIDDVFDYYTPVIAANIAYATENPEVIKAFMRAAAKGYQFAIENPDEAAEILCEQVPELDAALVAESQAFLADQYQAEAARWGDIDADRWAAYFEWLNDKGLVATELDPQAGWTTILHALAGLTQPVAGRVLLKGEDVTSKPGRVSYMLQKDLLLRHLTIVDNVCLPLSLAGVPKGEARERARGLFAQFGLEGTQDMWPSQLSGGMRQRAAFLRTYLMGNEVALLDEPFSALDAITRQELRAWYVRMAAELGISSLVITHDVDEAVSLAARVLVLAGRPAEGVPSCIAGEVEVVRPEGVGDFSLTHEYVDCKREVMELLEGNK